MKSRREYNREYQQAHKEQLKLYYRAYYQAHKDAMNESCKQYQRIHRQTIARQRKLKTPEELAAYEQEKASRRLSYYDNPYHDQIIKEHKALVDRQREAALKKEVLTYYGNGKLACVKCGFADIRSLSIDHINGGGHTHRQAIHHNIYIWLKQHGFPTGYQTLCLNDQFIKRYEEREYRGHSKSHIVNLLLAPVAITPLLLYTLAQENMHAS